MKMKINSQKSKEYNIKFHKCSSQEFTVSWKVWGSISNIYAKQIGLKDFLP